MTCRGLREWNGASGRRFRIQQSGCNMLSIKAEMAALDGTIPLKSINTKSCRSAIDLAVSFRLATNIASCRIRQY